MEIIEFITNLGIEYNPTREHFLFGHHKTLAYSTYNFLSLIIKKYIWKSKFKNATLSMDGFKVLLKSYLCDLKYMLQIKNLSEQLNEWNTVFDSL